MIIIPKEIMNKRYNYYYYRNKMLLLLLYYYCTTAKKKDDRRGRLYNYNTSYYIQYATMY